MQKLHDSQKVETNTARLATIDQLRETLLPNFFQPIPANETLREWFKKLPKFKANPVAKRGGGPVYYSVAAVEKFLRSRTLTLS